MKEVGGRKGELVGLDLPSASGGTEAGVRFPQPEEKQLRLGVKQLICDSPKEMRITQRILVAAIRTPDRDACFPEGTATLGQSQGEVCCWLWGAGPRGHAGGDCGGKCLWRQAGTPESRAGVAPSPEPLSPHACAGSWTERLAHQTPKAPTTEKEWGSPFSALRTDHQRRTPVSGAPVCAWHTEQPRPQAGGLSKRLTGRATEED